MTPSPALVHDWLTGMRGGEKVLAELGALNPAAPIFTLFHFPGSVSKAIESHPIRTSSMQNAPGLTRFYRSYLPLFPAAIEELDVSRYECVVSSSHCVAKSVLPAPGAYHLCYCHTPMRYAWDQEEAYFPLRHGPVARVRAQILAALRDWDAATSDRVDLFVANSNFVADRIRRYYGRRAAVVHPPVDIDFFTPGEEAGGTYALCVAALAPYKKVELAIDACERLGLELRIVGTGPERERLQKDSGTGVKFLGRVSDRELRHLYRGARCLIQPGIEDFGISSVESLACGTPVVALGLGGVLDIVIPGSHGILYPESGGLDALIEAIDKISEIESNSLDLRKRAEGFSAARFRELLKSLLDTRKTDSSLGEIG